MTGFWNRCCSFYFSTHNFEGCLPGSGGFIKFRTHQAWAKRRTINLKRITTERCLKSATVVVLIVKQNIAILFSNSDAGIRIRAGLAEAEYTDMPFWVGLCSCASLLLATVALYANFTSYTIFNSLSVENAPIILRSSIGRYASNLANDLVYASLLSLFLVAALSFIDLAEPGSLATIFVLAWAYILFHALHSSLAMGHTIINSGAMGCDPILSKDAEEQLSPAELSDELLKRNALARKAQIPVNYQYQIPYQNVLKQVEDEQIDLPIDPARLGQMRERKYTRKWHRH